MYASSQQCGGKCLAMMNVVGEKSQMGRNIRAATGYDRLNDHRVEASQQPQGKRVSRQLQGVTISAATECDYLYLAMIRT